MDCDHFFEVIKDNMKEFDSFKNEVVKHAVQIIAYMSTPEKAQGLLSDGKKTNAALILLSFYLKNYAKEQNFNVFVDLCYIYISPETVHKQYLVSQIMREMFDILNRTNLHQVALDLFSRVASFHDQNVFTNSKAYAVYAAYQLKVYDSVQKIIDTFFIDIKNEYYKECFDFCMLNFYKGLIFLAGNVSNLLNMYNISIIFLIESV